jgi:hypothetical protein
VARLTMGQRRVMGKEDFAIPEKAPGPGSYPIKDEAHVHAALMDCHNGEPGDCDRVRAAVKSKHNIEV